MWYSTIRIWSPQTIIRWMVEVALIDGTKAHMLGNCPAKMTSRNILLESPAGIHVSSSFDFHPRPSSANWP